MAQAKSMHQMVDMEMSDEEKLDQIIPMPMDRPDYPCGLRISLTEKEFEKLGLDGDDAEVGGIVHLHAMGRIDHCSSTKGEMGKSCRVEIQITALEIESESEENEEH